MWKKQSILVLLCLMGMPQILLAQKIYRSQDRWGNVRGDCIAKVENGNQIYRSSGAFCNQGNCIYIIQQNRVFTSSGAFCTIAKDCAFVMDGNYFYESDDPFGNYLGNVVFLVEENRIYKSVNGFGRGECLYIVEDNKVYNSFNPFGTMKDDCILMIEEGEITWIALLSILARRF